MRRLYIIKLVAWRSQIYIWVGEAMPSLEAAIANAVKPGTKVLAIDNGVYGSGFADLVKMYGGVPITPGLNWRRASNPSAVVRFLERVRGLGFDVQVGKAVEAAR